MVDAKAALKRFELENNVQDREIYELDEALYNKLIAQDVRKFVDRPWNKDPLWFKNVKVSAVALIKMAMHAREGGDIEIMGNLMGFPRDGTMWITDVYALPVIGTETRVISTDETSTYSVAHQDASAKCDRIEGKMGWYHSHPGYGCWLSLIDINT